MLNEKVAVVTGASSGIGRSTAEQLVQMDYTVVLCGRNREKLEHVCSEINTGNGNKAHFFCLNIKDEGFIREVFQFTLKNFGKSPDVIILSAGIGTPGTVLSSDPSHWKELIEVNYSCQIYHLRESANRLIEANKEANLVKDIVFIGSTVGREISAANPIYGSTKAAMHYIIESLRRELSSHGIRLTLIEPGFVKTEYQQNSGYDMDWFTKIEEQFGPLLLPEDIADAIAYIITRPKHIHIDNIRLRPTRQTV